MITGEEPLLLHVASPIPLLVPVIATTLPSIPDTCGLLLQR